MQSELPGLDQSAFQPCAGELHPFPPAKFLESTGPGSGFLLVSAGVGVRKSECGSSTIEWVMSVSDFHCP